MQDIQTTGGIYTKEIQQLIVKNICEVFSCKEVAIKDLEPLQAGLTNIVLSFSYNGGRYVYRHPGLGSEMLVERGRETIMQAVVVQAGIDTTLVAMDVEAGWRISKYIEHRKFDYNNLNDMVRAMVLFQELHKVSAKVRWEFDVVNKAEMIKTQIPSEQYGNFAYFDDITERCYKLYEYAKKDGIKKCYIHGDARDENFLINNEDIFLIDWEYGGFGDPGFDIGSYVCGGKHSIEDIDRIIFTYLCKEPTKCQKRHFYAYIGLTGWFYLHWVMLKESKGQKVGYLKDYWYNYALDYSNIALKMYEGDESI